MAATPSNLEIVVDQLSRAPELDGVAAALERVGSRVVPDGTAGDLLRGKPLGHAAHPLLTDLPIGFWTSAMAIDLLSPRKGRKAARRLVALGVLTAAPTALSGLADWLPLKDGKRRVGTVHAAANAVATVLYGCSYVARRRGHQARGVAWGLAGASAATLGGFLGGHLAFGPEEAPAPAPDERLTNSPWGEPVDLAGLERDGVTALADSRRTVSRL